MTIHPNGVATIDGDTHHGVWCAADGLIHDRWMAEQITRYISPDDFVINVGANIGTLTRAMLDAGAKVMCFEPNPEAVECLRHNCPEAVALEMALADRDGYVRFHRSDNAGASYCSPDGDGTSVFCASLDNLYISQRIHLILADMEGWETKMLRGAREKIERDKPIIICEVNRGALERAGSSEAELLGLIESYGYGATVLQPDCHIGSSPQYDVLCLPK